MNAAAPELPPQVAEAVEAFGGALLAWAQPRGTSGQTWHRIGTSRDVACTRVRSGRAWAQWRDAATATAGAPWAPSVVALEEPWLVCAWIDGAAVTPTPGQAAAAARVLRSLQSCCWPGSEDPVPASVALRRRVDALAARVRGHADLEADARCLGAMAASLRDVRRVPCHRDPRPENWIDTGGALALIDFEHARPDVEGTDEATMWCSGWFDDDDVRRAFVEAAGHEPLGRGAFALLAGLRALGTVARARSGGGVVEADGGEARLRAWRGLANR